MDHNIDRLRFAAMDLLLRLSRRFPKKRTSTIFLVNNFHHIVQVSGGQDLSQECQRFWAVAVWQEIQALHSVG